MITTTPRKPYQKPPKWQGFVNDGWGVDADGARFFVSHEARMAEVSNWLDTAAERLPFLTGNAPSAFLDEARRVLRLLPRGLLRALYAGGVQILIEERCGIDLDGGYVRGAVFQIPRIARIPCYQKDIEGVLLHEVGHLFDGLSYEGLSGSIRWRAIWNNELAAGRVPAANDQRTLANEYFAESFRKYFGGHLGELSNAVRAFLADKCCGEIPSPLPKLESKQHS